MRNRSPVVDAVNHNMTLIKRLGVGHLQTEHRKLEGTTINLNGLRTHHFGSCSYLNLEIDPRYTFAPEGVGIRCTF